MREAVATLIRRVQHTAEVVEFDNPAEAMQAGPAHGTPKLICLELQSQGTHGLSRLAGFKKQWPDTALVVLTAAAGQGLEAVASEAGASALLHKSESSATIATVLRGLLGGEAAGEKEAAPAEKLSKRQKQLLNLLDKGMSNRDIAESLEISEHTVKVHLWRLFRRLNVKSRSQASHLARTQGLL